ncbi:MAG TPA: hypothetical protein VIL51_01985 [Thermoleophilia bacterium]
MRTIFTLLVVAALITVLAIDGVGMYSAHHKAVEGAQAAAQQAAEQYVAGDATETAARQAADNAAQSAGAEVMSITFRQADTRWVEVTVRARPHVYLLSHVPYLRTHLSQGSTAVVHF